ncbi:GNAT family N-acetyltransferase [Actinobacteria bacterium YIM 96077]|uniref:GNAT family N-acetyltransferase n=2 Tax=Phytoactinopolyspora halophila TaxID=1981511 RepID=A0A329QNL1_9ACTN|nr:GNAT family N-acetyltransferase [Actinobacteria bacterium YIM 96077]RAW13843.1 GNAT family N-acetyltransferase [Phytoactinopolyspora halophila]
MDAVADDAPPTIEQLTEFHEAGRAWVIADESDRPVAYVLLDVVDGFGHVEQVSVHPHHARRGLGRRLVDAASDWAYEHGLAGLTLTAYTDVPWNAPYYRRLGFRDLADEEMPDGLRAIRRREAEHGLDAWPRVAMVKLHVN